MPPFCTFVRNKVVLAFNFADESQSAMSKVSFAPVSKQSFVQNHSHENVSLLIKSNSFSFERFFTKIRFETEAPDNSEMVCWRQSDNANKALYSSVACRCLRGITF